MKLDGDANKYSEQRINPVGTVVRKVCMSACSDTEIFGVRFLDDKEN